MHHMLDQIYVMILGLKRDPTESQYIHCLQRGGGAALIRTQLLGSSLPKGCGGAQAIRPEQAKQQKRREDYLSLEESPASPSNTGCRSPQERPSIHSQRSERSASSIHTCFPFIGNVMSRSRTTSEQSRLNGRKASDWLKPESTA